MSLKQDTWGTWESFPKVRGQVRREVVARHRNEVQAPHLNHEVIYFVARVSALYRFNLIGLRSMSGATSKPYSG